MFNDDMWDRRYGSDDYHFGTEPAAFLAAQAGHIPAGSRVLCVADGEGRNSVYLAGLGHRVTAFDASQVGVDKAVRLAANQGAEVAYHVSGIEDWDWSGGYDAVVAVFIQFAPPEMRAKLFGWMADAIRPGGLLLLHGYAPRQIDNGTGGPPFVENMYTEDLLRTAFDGWEILRIADYDAVIEEGTGHSGQSALVDLVARKPG